MGIPRLLFFACLPRGELWLRWPLTTRAPYVLEAVANPQRADVTADGAR